MYLPHVLCGTATKDPKSPVPFKSVIPMTSADSPESGLTYAKMLGYTHIEVVNVNDEKELERVRVLTCWKRL